MLVINSLSKKSFGKRKRYRKSIYPEYRNSHTIRGLFINYWNIVN